MSDEERRLKKNAYNKKYNASKKLNKAAKQQEDVGAATPIANKKIPNATQEEYECHLEYSRINTIKSDNKKRGVDKQKLVPVQDPARRELALKYKATEAKMKRDESQAQARLRTRKLQNEWNAREQEVNQVIEAVRKAKAEADPKTEEEDTLFLDARSHHEDDVETEIDEAEAEVEVEAEEDRCLKLHKGLAAVAEEPKEEEFNINWRPGQKSAVLKITLSIKISLE